jgi:hypothetical protein
MDEHSAEASSVASLAAASASGSLDVEKLAREAGVAAKDYGSGTRLQLECEDGSTWDVTTLLHRFAAAVLEEAAKVCEQEAVDEEATYADSDHAYNTALQHAATAIRALKP